MKIKALFVLILLSGPAFAQDDALLQTLTVAKITGGCSMIHQMGQFQTNSKMPGGDQFLSRFIEAEAARQGHSPGDFLKNCSSAIATYQQVWQAAGGK